MYEVFYNYMKNRDDLKSINSTTLPLHKTAPVVFSSSARSSSIALMAHNTFISIHHIIDT